MARFRETEVPDRLAATERGRTNRALAALNFSRCLAGAEDRLTWADVRRLTGAGYREEEILEILSLSGISLLARHFRREARRPV